MNQEKIKDLEKTINSDYSNIAGIVVQKNGTKLYEHYFNECTATSRIHVYSVTKSIISILIGIAMDKGYIKDINHGMWNGKQIVSKGWIDESTKEHSRWEKLNLPYGYLWWVGNDKERGYAAMGDGGNIIYVNTKKKMVVSIASLFVPKVKDRIKFIKEYIEPIFED